jgi:hypothetical protein
MAYFLVRLHFNQSDHDPQKLVIWLAKWSDPLIIVQYSFTRSIVSICNWNAIANCFYDNACKSNMATFLDAFERFMDGIWLCFYRFCIDISLKIMDQFGTLELK